MSAEALVQSITENAISNSNRLVDKAVGYADQAVSQSYLAFGAFNTPVINPQFLDVNLQQFDITQDLRADYETKYNDIFDKLVPLAKTKFDEFMAHAFPNEATWNELGEFLMDGIRNGGIGLPEHIENQIWQRARDRLELQAQTSIDAVYSEASSRGFTIPPEAVFGSISKIKNDTNRLLSAQNTDLAIEVAKLRIEWVKFAVEKVIDMRRMALQSAIEFINVIFKACDSANQKATGYISSYQNFYNSLNSYYNAVMNVNELRFKVASANASLISDTQKTSVHAHLGALQARVSATTEMAKSMGTVAGTVSAGINTLASIGNHTNLTA